MKKKSQQDTVIDGAVNHPVHYTGHPSGVEAIDITGTMDFPLGNAFKYVFRRNLKSATQQDLKKAIWYCNYSINRPRFEPEEVTGKVVSVCAAESLRVGLALSNIYMANNVSCEETKTKLLAAAIDLLETELYECYTTK